MLNETFKREGGFVTRRDQIYLELKQGDDTFLLGFSDILLCLRLMEQMREIPEISYEWWESVDRFCDFDKDMIIYN